MERTVRVDPQVTSDGPCGGGMVFVWGKRVVFMVGEKGTGGMFGQRKEWGRGDRLCFL